MFLTGKHMSRRTALRGLGATIALPLLDSMIPARAVFAQTAAGARRRPHAARLHRAGARRGRLQRVRHDRRTSGVPAATGRNFDLSKGSLSSLEPFRKHLTIVSNTDARMAEALGAGRSRRRPLPLERGDVHAVRIRS